MYIPKVYGASKNHQCPFCSRQGIRRNKQDIPVCEAHINQEVPEIKCDCGSYLDLRSGKYGSYFNCINCGNKNFTKALESHSANKNFNVQKPVIKEEKAPQSIQREIKVKKELVIRSDNPDWFG